MDGNMSDQWVDKLSEYIDGDLNADEVKRLESHLDDCIDCREVLSQLEAVVRTASGLLDEKPANDLWQGIAERIDTSRVVELSPRAATTRVLQFSIPQLAVAAIALMMISGGLVSRFTGNGSVPADVVAAVQGPSEGLFLAGSIEGDYQHAIADLEVLLEEGKDLLDPETIRVLKENIEIIDQAIQEARRALAVDPGSPYLNRYLTRTMRRKLDVLEHGNNLIATASL